MRQAGSETADRGPERSVPELARAQAKFTQVYQERCSAAWQRYVEAVRAASEPLMTGRPTRPRRGGAAGRHSYWLDFAQRSVLFWDTLRQRGNNWIEHEKAGKPPLLDFDWEMVADARTLRAARQLCPGADRAAGRASRPIRIAGPS